jgi:hypothetical protein
VTRFIDDATEFLHVPAGEVFEVLQMEEALACDIPRAELSHAGDLCSFPRDQPGSCRR